MDYKALIHQVPDFPKPGVMFKDISPLLQNSVTLESLVKDLGALVDHTKIDSFVGIESRGFILAAALAFHFKKGFIPLRKAGKLPPPTFHEKFKLEYGEAALEIRPGSGRVVIVDDVLATGGTLQAALNLNKKAGYTVEDILVLINLRFLNKFIWRLKEVKSLIQYD